MYVYSYTGVFSYLYTLCSTVPPPGSDPVRDNPRLDTPSPAPLHHSGVFRRSKCILHNGAACDCDRVESKRQNDDSPLHDSWKRKENSFRVGINFNEQNIFPPLHVGQQSPWSGSAGLGSVQLSRGQVGGRHTISPRWRKQPVSISLNSKLSWGLW